MRLNRGARPRAPSRTSDRASPVEVSRAPRHRSECGAPASSPDRETGARDEVLDSEATASASTFSRAWEPTRMTTLQCGEPNFLPLYLTHYYLSEGHFAICCAHEAKLRGRVSISRYFTNFSTNFENPISLLRSFPDFYRRPIFVGDFDFCYHIVVI